jgi:Mn-dependent DtxR family transcriptional regulator
MTADAEFLILEHIYGSSESETPVKQRDLAQIAGLSLGMTNAILKRLATKGLIVVKKLTPRNVRYAITLEGMTEVINRSYGYFKRTIKNIALYKETLNWELVKAKTGGLHKAALLGKSDMDFILEHLCGLHEMPLLREPPAADTTDCLLVYPETVEPPLPGERSENTLYLSSLAGDVIPWKK